MAENFIDQRTAASTNIGAAVEEEEDESSVDLVTLYRTLRRGRWTIFGLSFGALAVATTVAFLLPSQYTSTATFIPPNLGGGSSVASAVAGQLSVLGGGDLLGGVKTPGDVYAGILRSRSVTSQLVKRFNLIRVYGVKNESQAENVIAANTLVAVDAKSTIVTVSVVDKSPAMAQNLANAYMDALRETEGRLALGQSSQRRLFFGQQLAKEKDDLENAEVELTKTEERSGLIEPVGQTEAEIRTIAETRAQISLREVQLAALREAGTEQNDQVIRLRSEIADLQAQLAGLQKGSSNGTLAAIPASKVPQLQLDYVRKEREVKYHEALFDMLSKQYEAARLDEAHDAPVLQVLDTASYPDAKSSPKRSYIMLGGLFAGFLAGCVWVLARDGVQAFRASLASGGEAA